MKGPVPKRVNTSQFSIQHIGDFKQKMLNWLQPFNIFCFLDNGGYPHSTNGMDYLAAAGATACLQMQAGSAFQALGEFRKAHPGWLFGHLGYDLKNETEALHSRHPDGVGFDDLLFFVPEVVCKVDNHLLTIWCNDDPATIFQSIQSASSAPSPIKTSPAQIQSRFSREEYIQSVQQLLHHIHRGDAYELNFCQEFFAEEVDLDPLQIYQSLMAVSSTPFAALYRNGDRYCCCASPERYLKRTGNQILSQPIKGTAKRILHDEAADQTSKTELLNSEKERSEHVMVVDLVRNDLSRVAQSGSVQVAELMGLYSFPQVHQLISTVVGETDTGFQNESIIKATFPMGSMTGAPKKKVMELIEQYERTRRGLYSGAIGYVEPNGDFDFNVVIRSILYNSAKHYVSFSTGSAITSQSDPVAEYEECLLKAAAMRSVLGV